MSIESIENKVTEVKIEDLKKKYAGQKVYEIGHTVQIDDETEDTFSFLFRKPLPLTYDRYLKTASKSMSSASRAFVLDNVVTEQTGGLIATLEEYPAMAITVAEKLLKMLGLGDNTTVKKL